MNQVSLTGRLTRDPELKHIPSTGTPVANFTLAVDKGLSKDKKMEFESKNMPTADFIRIVAWNKVAENCVNFITKGSLVGVSGRIQTGSYDDTDGKRVFTTDVVATTVDFLSFGDNKNKPDDNDMPDGFHPTDEDDIPF